MRTTLDIDDALLAKAQAMFPPGTPKTVLFEEGLRRLIGTEVSAASPTRRRRDPRMQRLIDDGRIIPATFGGPMEPPSGQRVVPLADLLDDLARDREDR